MKNSKNLQVLFSFFGHLFFFIVLVSLECLFIAPQSSLIEFDLWMAPLVFIGLHRRIALGLFFALFASLFFGAFSGQPYHLSLICFSLVILLIHAIKLRSFTKGSTYFAICSALSILVFYLSLSGLTWVLGGHPISHPHILKWITSALASSALFIFIRPLFIFIDKIFNVTYPFGFEA